MTSPHTHTHTRSHAHTDAYGTGIRHRSQSHPNAPSTPTHMLNTVERAHGQIAPSVICPNAADIEQFTLKGVDRVAAKKALGLENKVVCGYVGAFVYWDVIDWFV